MWKPKRNRCAPFERASPWVIGLPEAVLLGTLGGVLLGATLGWRWGAGIPWGTGAIVLGRLSSWAYYPILRGSPRVTLAAGTMAGARILLYGAVAVLGISLGLEPLAICVGLLLPGLILKMRLLFGFGEGKCWSVWGKS